jgi:type VII secretion-associated serine protease mycosin
LLLGLATPAAAGPGEADTDLVPTGPATAGDVIAGEVIVQFRDAPAAEGARRLGLPVVAEITGGGLATDAPDEVHSPVVLSTGGRPVADVLAELSADPGVALAEPNYVVELAEAGSLAVAVNDPKTNDQYSLDRMRVRDAWSITRGGGNVIAVLDTGVQLNHPDLAGRLVAGYDFVNGDSNASDDNGHGTWVAGIIAANANDAYGIAGISWTDKIMPVKIMNREGTGSTADLLAAIRWSADRGADVINMSVGGFPYSQMLQDAVNYAWGKGAVLVGAAGNNRREETYYPASFDNVISVSATQPQDEFSNWSSYGPKVDVSAPGSSILTTNCYVCTYAAHDTWGSHTYISGTSFATPNVAGVVALIRAEFPSFSPAEVVTRLYATVDDMGYRGWDNRYGRGRVNALRALGGAGSASGTSSGDALEPNNGISAARLITLNTTTRPTIHPAGDVDAFAVDVPRAGRLDVRVTGVVDTRAYPWNRSGLPIDPVVELYTSAGSLIVRVDNEWEAGTELASVNVSGPARILVRISNYYPNGNPSAYSITPTYVDTVAPTATITAPAANAVDVSRFANAIVTFSEPVTNVTASSIVLRDLTTSGLVASAVTYDAATRTARLDPNARLEALRQYRVEVTTAVRDGGGNSVGARSLSFTTGLAGFEDTAGSHFVAEINWLAAEGITSGCSETRFCPTRAVTREQMASFVVRGVGLPASGVDAFTDDNSSIHEPAIDAIAAAGVSNGCGRGRFCPTWNVTRAQMASFLARALGLPAASTDYFSDDAGSIHEADINRVAAAGITIGCTAGSYCPDASVSREQMAAFLYRALADS